ncbi:hypothetical protein ABL840_09105 [Variovorax sp. NFACC27]|uniref:hypothetical protein n=1 Tax=unclassified Variovorax TaxID=663243 RepID=UPI000B8823A0
MTNKTSDDLMVGAAAGALALILGVPFVAATVAIAAIWSGYVFHLLWLWFIVPTFSLPALSIPLAVGVSLTVSFIARGQSPSEKGKPWWKTFLEVLLRPAFVLLIAWIVKGFI